MFIIHDCGKGHSQKCVIVFFVLFSFFQIINIKLLEYCKDLIKDFDSTNYFVLQRIIPIQ